MLEKMKAAFSRLGVIAANYLPPGFKDALLEMAHRSDLQEQEIAELRRQMAVLDSLVNTNR
jgi:hypothetical protein